jgi:hypothetical protein
MNAASDNKDVLLLTAMCCLALLTAVFPSSLYGQSSVVYSGFAWRWLGGGEIDLDNDGIGDLMFSSDYHPFATTTYFVNSSMSTGIATDNGEIQLWSYGVEIGASIPSGIWSLSPGSWPVLIQSSTFNGVEQSGPLMDVGGTGYLAFRWQQQDGSHYGWARLTVEPVIDPASGGMVPTPTCIDWAYESRPEFSIAAGEVPEPSTWALFGMGGFFARFCIRRPKMAKVRIGGSRV